MEHAILFVKKGDDWGRMFSYVEMIAKVFPKFSDFDILRQSSQDLYYTIKVRENLPMVSRQKKKYVSFVSSVCRKSSMISSSRLIRTMNATSSTCTSSKWNRRKLKRRVHFAVSSMRRLYLIDSI